MTSMKHRTSWAVRTSLPLVFLAHSCWAQQQFGVGIHNGNISQIIGTYVSPLGLSLRTDFHWKYIEDKQGTLSMPASLQSLEGIINTAASAGAKPLISLNYGNKYYDGGDLVKSPAAIQAFDSYTKFIVNRFKGHVTQFEVWNEWNLNTSSTTKPHVWGDVPSYVNLLKAAYATIKSQNPNAVVIGGVVGGTDDRWIDKFIEAGGLSYLDAFSVHPYVQRHVHRPNPPTITVPSGAAVSDVPTIQTVAGTPEESIAWIDNLKARIDKASPSKTIPIYVSEIGWPTSSGDYGVSESVAAAYLQRFILMIRARPWVAGVWWYDLQDDGSDATNSEDRFGLVTQTGEPKPGYTALTQLSDVLKSNATFQEKVGTSGQITISGETAGGKKYVASWLPTDDFSRTQQWVDGQKMLQSGYANVSASTTPKLPSVGASPTLLVQP